MEKLDKRACRKYADLHWRADVGNGLFHFEQVRYITRAAVKLIAGHRVLILYLYEREQIIAGGSKPRFTVFLTHSDYVALETMEDGKQKWRASDIYGLICGYGGIDRNCVFYRLSDAQRVARFCGDTEGKPFDSLSRLQMKIQGKRRKLVQRKREQVIIDRMMPIPPLPRGIKRWTQKDVLPSYIFYEYRKSQTMMPGYCTHCEKDVLVEKPKHNQKGICPYCKKQVTFKAIGKSKHVWDRTTVQTVQRVGDELVIRICKAHIGYSDYRKPKLDFWENARLFIREQNGRCHCEPYYYSYNKGERTHWLNGERPYYPRYIYHFEADTVGYLFDKNLAKELQGTPWQYCQLEEFNRGIYGPMEVRPYLFSYISYPVLEYLVKQRLFYLASDVVYRFDWQNAVNPKGHNLKEVLGIDKSDLPILREANVDVKHLKLFQILKSQGTRCDAAFLRWCEQLELIDGANLIRCLRYMTQGKLMRYVGEQYEKLKTVTTRYGIQRYGKEKQVFQEYQDYLRLCEDLNYDLHDDFILFPRHLNTAHDSAAENFDAQKTRIFNERIAAAYNALVKQYQMTRYGLTMIPPRSADEIIAEGQKLHHCVGRYVSDVAEHGCIILFLRRANEPDEPFYTVEIRNGKVAQIRGMDNGEPSKEVENYMALWERKKLKEERGIALKAA